MEQMTRASITAQVLQPRRMAARAAARRCAALLGEPVGRRVGYTVRLDSKTSRATRVEFVTTGVLLRRLMQQVQLFWDGGHASQIATVSVE